jgi:hypothetical protein
MRTMLMPLGIGLALFVSCGFAVGQGHEHRGGGGAIHGSGGGGFHGPSGGGFRGPSGGSFRSAPSRMTHTYRAERAPHSYRVERTRRAESQRVERSQRVQGERHQGRDARSVMRANERAAQERHGRGEAGRLEQRVAQRHTEIQNARMQLSGDNKERLHHAFDMNRARARNVNFDHHVGRRIPRRIHLFAIPAAVFAFFPYYEDYSYFVVDDDICIVDPRTYVVVDVINAAYWNGPGRPHVAGLDLSTHEIAIVRESIPADFSAAEIHLRLALGAEIPEDVRLHEFAPFVLDRVPLLRRYRFLVAGDEIVIVQPGDRSIALVIDRV